MEGKIQITIWSLLAEDASGSATILVEPSITVGDLLLQYCSEKRIEVSPYYTLSSSANKILNATKSLKDEHINNGEILTLTVEDSKKNKPFVYWRMASILTLIIGIGGLTYVLFMFLAPMPSPGRHGIVVDAGSSHSHMFLFNWNPQRTESADNLRIIHECYMPGGIAQYRSQPDELLPYFEQCLKEVMLLVPRKKRKETELILGATAGMRILQTCDPDGASMILSAIRKIFVRHTAFKVNANDVFIVSGQKEGINGWRAVNFLSEQDNHFYPVLNALDLGGASLQVSILLEENTGKWPYVNVKYNNETFHLFSKSFMCYGVVKSQYRSNYLLGTERTNKSTTVLQNPCLPGGTNMVFTKMDKAEPCVLSKIDDLYDINMSHFVPKDTNYLSKYIDYYVKKHSNPNKDTPLEDKKLRDFLSVTNKTNKFLNKTVQNVSSGEQEVLYKMEGSNNAQECRNHVGKLFDYELCFKAFGFGDCLNREHIPPYKGKLVGFSSIFFFIFPVLQINKNATLAEFKDAVFGICNKDYDALKVMDPDLPEALAQQVCFEAMYIYTLLTEGLGVTEDNWKDIKFEKQVKHQDVEWVLGLMLKRTFDSQQIHKRINGMEVTSFVLLVALFSACILISVLFMCNTVRLQMRKSSYQRVLNENLDQRMIVDV